MTATRSVRAEQLAAFHARHAERLRRIVGSKVRSACAQTIEDACQTAWATLVRREDITLDERGARWLATVAIHEGWRLTTGRGDVPMGVMRAGAAQEHELPEPPATVPAADEQGPGAHRARPTARRPARATRPVPAGPWVPLRRDHTRHRLQLRARQPAADRRPRPPPPAATRARSRGRRRRRRRPRGPGRGRESPATALHRA